MLAVSPGPALYCCRSQASGSAARVGTAATIAMDDPASASSAGARRFVCFMWAIIARASAKSMGIEPAPHAHCTIARRGGEVAFEALNVFDCVHVVRPIDEVHREAG